MLRTFIGIVLVFVSSLVYADKLLIGVESIDQFPVYKGDSVTNTYSGFAHDLLLDFAEKNGHTIEFKMLPILRLHDEFLQSKLVDFKFPDNLEWNSNMRKGLIIKYSNPVLTVTEGLSVTPDYKGNGVANIKVIGAMRGFTPWQYLEAIKAKKITFSELTSFEALVKMAETHRIDGLFANSYVVNYYLTETVKRPNLLVFDDSLPYTKTTFHLSSIKYPKIINQFDAYLIKEKLAIEKLKLKYKLNKPS